MNTSDTNNKNDNQLMDEYGITSTTKVIYHYQNYNYEKLKDALSFAEIDRKRNLTTSGNRDTHAVKKTHP